MKVQFMSCSTISLTTITTISTTIVSTCSQLLSLQSLQSLLVSILIAAALSPFPTPSSHPSIFGILQPLFSSYNGKQWTLQAYAGQQKAKNKKSRLCISLNVLTNERTHRYSIANRLRTRTCSRTYTIST